MQATYRATPHDTDKPESQRAEIPNTRACTTSHPQALPDTHMKGCKTVSGFRWLSFLSFRLLDFPLSPSDDTALLADLIRESPPPRPSNALCMMVGLLYSLNPARSRRLYNTAVEQALSAENCRPFSERSCVWARPSLDCDHGQSLMCLFRRPHSYMFSHSDN